MKHEYEAWVCPMRYVLVDANEEGDGFISSIRQCDAELHIVWTFSWPVPTELAEIRSYTGIEVAANAYTTGWEVVCEEGHRLANHSRSSEDYAEDIDVASVMQAIGAKLRPDHVHSLRGGGHHCVDCGKDME